MAGIEEGFLVSTPLSHLYAQQPISISIPPTRTNTHLPPNSNDSDIYPEHAIFSTVLNTQYHGAIALRLLHGGYILELISLTFRTPPLRIVLPASVLPSVGLFLIETGSLHVIAVTSIGSLYRLVVNIDGQNLWQNQNDIVLPREYFICSFPEGDKSLVHVEGTHSVTIALPNASILRIEATSSGEDEQEEQWTETLFSHASFFSPLTSLFHSGLPNSSDIISIASYPWPTDIGHIWTISRDRTLRLWKAKVGCVSTKNLILLGNQAISSSSSSNNGNKHPLLDPSPQTLLKVFSHDTRVFVLAFVPTISATLSGGVFRLFDTYADSLHDLGSFECSKNTVHCYLQDFIIFDNVLYTLWERQGRSMVELADLSLDDMGHNFKPTWRAAHYVNEPELTPAYMEEQLLVPGSLTEKYLEALLRPGIFSSLTLKTAIDQYTDTCLSLPVPPPPQLTVTHSSVEEQIAAVVGCTVNLNRDPQTGATQHAAYWTALKRDWEGFIARCREIERSSRWPLTLGIANQKGIVIMERERVGLLVNEDLPIQLQRLSTESSVGLGSQYELLSVLCRLRKEVGPQVMSNLQNRVVDILHQEIPFSFGDVLQDQTRRISFRESLADSGEWFTARLQSMGDLDNAVRMTLDVIGGFDVEVKREEEDTVSLIVGNPSELSTGLTVGYITTTIRARYDLCLSLVTLFFFIADELATWDPSLLAEVFAVFRGAAMLRQIANQPTKPQNDQHASPTDPDDVILRMRNMNFSNANSTTFTPKLSLLHLLLSQSERKSGFPVAAHHFLDSTGLLQSVSPANVTQHEVLLCEKVRLLGLYDVARDLLAWLPRTPGTVFVLASVWLQIGRPADAAQLLEKLAASFDTNAALTQEDRDALIAIIPSAHLFDTSFAFYVHVSDMFKKHLLIYYEVMFAQLAISVASSGFETSALWSNVIKGYLDLGRYDDAYAVLMSNPYEKQKRELVSRFTFQMCESDAIDAFMAFDFAGIADEVEAALSFKARNAEPKSRPPYAHILYTWYIQRGNYRNGALTMYQQAQKLAASIANASSFVETAQLELEAYTVAINALSLVDSKNAWITVPKIGQTFRSRRVVLNHIPDNRFSARKYDAEIIHLTDIQYDCALLRAQIDIIRKDPTLLHTPDFLLPPALIVLRLANMNFYDQALTTAHALSVDMSDVFRQLTTRCLRLSRNPDNIIQEDGGDWLLTDNVVSWARTPAERGWNYLQQSLQRHDGPETDYRHSKAVLETILTYDKGTTAPPWLIQIIEKHQPECLVRAALKYERLDLAVQHSLAMIRKSDTTLIRESPRNAAATWLPYNLFDQVLVAAAEQPNPPLHVVELRSQLGNRLQRLSKLAQEAR